MSDYFHKTFADLTSKSTREQAEFYRNVDEQDLRPVQRLWLAYSNWNAVRSESTLKNDRTLLEAGLPLREKDA